MGTDSPSLPPVIAATSAQEAALEGLWRRYVADLRAFDPDLVYDGTSFSRLMRAATSPGGAPLRVLVQPERSGADARLLGFLVARTRMPSRTLSGGTKLEGFVSDCYVLEEARRSGVARRLHAAALAFYAEHGIGTIGLMVLAANAQALRFWESLGYRDHLRELRLHFGSQEPPSS